MSFDEMFAGVPVRQETIYFYNYPNTVEIENVWVIDRAIDGRLNVKIIYINSFKHECFK